MSRALRVVLWAAALWASVAWTTTHGADLLPPTRDQRPGHVSPAPEPRHALFMMDVELMAELAVAEDPDAVAAVTWVVLNRAQGRGLLEVVTERRQFGTRKGGRWVPSWPKDRKWRQDHREAVQSAAQVATAVLAGLEADPTGEATHYHRRGTWTPTWAPSPEAWRQVGRHWFYRARSPRPR